MHGGRSGLDGLAEDLANQRRVVDGRCPAYERALGLLPEVLAGAPGRLLAAAWSERRFFAPYERPLLLLAALRFDARAEGPGHPLHRAFAARPPDADAVTAPALAHALGPRRERVYDLLARRAVQTNETSRAVAWLWPVALAIASGAARRIALADVGASAGLNLVADALPAPWAFEDGTPVPVARGAPIVARLGFDASPLDANAEADADWLRACVWPGETRREDRLEESLAAFRAARTRPDAPVLTPVWARNVPARLDLLSASELDALVIAYQTVMRDYLSPDERDEYAAGMHGWLATHPPGRALWVELENVPGATDPARATAIVAHVRGGAAGRVESLELARCGYHPSVLHRDAAGVAQLTTALADADRRAPAAGTATS
jgi:hypothetical protein